MGLGSQRCVARVRRAHAGVYVTKGCELRFGGDRERKEGFISRNWNFCRTAWECVTISQISARCGQA